MKRRSFLKTTVIGGAATAASQLVLESCHKDKAASSFVTMVKKPEVSLLAGLENEWLKVDILSDASTSVIDKKNSITWQSGPVALQEFGPIDEGHVWLRQERSMCEEYPGRFVGKKKNNNEIEFTLLGRQDRIMGRFTCHVHLEENSIVYRISRIDESIQSLVFPTPFLCSALVLPSGIGKLVTERPSRGIYARQAQTFFTHLNMRWIGGLNDKGGWLGIYEEGFEDAGAIIANRTASPAWMKTLGRWQHPFVFRIKFIKGNYVDLAKEYRRWFISKGLFKSLKDKITENENLKKFLGGRAFWFNLAHPAPRKKELEDILFTPDQVSRKGNDGDVIVHCTYAKAKEILSRYEALGMKKGLIKIAGWINRGYDASHPDIWPPEPKLGTLDELKELMQFRKQWVMGLHDNYMDIYDNNPSFPKGVIRQADGSLMTGGFWAGGQAYIMNYRDSLQYARRNWEQIKTLMPQAMFVDTTTAMQLYQSYEKGNEYTKADDLHYKMELIRFFKQQGVLFGSEEVADFAIPLIDWFENRHRRKAGESIPLWPLVFHDAAFCMRYHPEPKEYPAWLEDMLYGYMLHFFNGENFDEKYFASTFHVDQWHELIGTDEMISHRFLTEDNSVEETIFSSGKRIVCNFGNEKYADQKGTVKPHNYIITT